MKENLVTTYYIINRMMRERERRNKEITIKYIYICVNNIIRFVYQVNKRRNY